MASLRLKVCNKSTYVINTRQFVLPADEFTHFIVCITKYMFFLYKMIHII